jgi:hypothetical protein
MSATVVGTAQSPEIPAAQTLDRSDRGPQNALDSLDLDPEPGEPAHRDRYTTSTATTRGVGTSPTASNCAS